MLYTFRTFPAIGELEKLDDTIFIFSRLKEDMRKLEELIAENAPDTILGIAATKGPTRVEPITINKFNRGRVTRDGPDSFELCVPDLLAGFKVASKPTHSFCNWTMYRIALLLHKKGLSTKLIFIHLNLSDINKLTSREDVYALL